MKIRKPSMTMRVGKLGLDEAGADFIAAWKRGEAGDLRPVSVLQFETWDLLAKALTPKRLDLIRHVRSHRITKVAELARALKRDYRNVYDDVAALTEAGLLEKTAEGLRAPFDRIAAEIRI